MVQAYILVQTEVGKAAEVARLISEISGVTQAEDVTGPYDVIVRAEAENVDDLGRLVVAHIQGVSGTTRPLTFPIVHIGRRAGSGVIMLPRPPRPPFACPRQPSFRPRRQRPFRPPAATAFHPARLNRLS